MGGMVEVVEMAIETIEEGDWWMVGIRHGRGAATYGQRTAQRLTTGSR